MPTLWERSTPAAATAHRSRWAWSGVLLATAVLAAACGLQVNVEQSSEPAPAPDPGAAAVEPASSGGTEAPSPPEAEASPTSSPASPPAAPPLPVAAEHDPGYDRDDWGPHNSGLCRGAVGTPDPYTGTPIDTCNVDHVVALDEAHESGGWAWPSGMKRRFSQDPANHVASRACVNQSKGGDDLSEWSDADIASSSACGGGYKVTAAGRCFLARTTVAVKSDYGLSVDRAEADALGATLAACGDPALRTAASGQSPGDAAPPTTTGAPRDDCVIAGRTEAEYDAVSGIGPALAPRLAAAQPFASGADLEAVKGIGPVKAGAVWAHFC